MSEHPGADVLDLVATYISRFVQYPSRHVLIAHTLWCAHTHLIESFGTTPRLVFTSAGPAMGKSRALKMTELFAREAMNTFGSSPAYIFRTMPERPGMTLLLDEYDGIFGSGRTPGAEQMRVVINGGFDGNASIGRMDKTTSGGFRSVEFKAFGPIALGGIGPLPETIRSRSIVVNMRPPARGQRPEPWRARDNAAEAAEIHDDLAAWADSVGHEVAWSRPVLPPSIIDRRADVWEPLIAVADAAGSSWPRAVRDAAAWFTTQDADQAPAWGIQLLTDIRTVFTDRPGTTALWTEDLITALRGLPESAWDPAAGGHELTPRRLASLLADYQMRSRDVRQGDRVKKGYTLPPLNDAFAHYLPELEQQPDAPQTSAHGERARRGPRRGRRTGHTTTPTQEA